VTILITILAFLLLSSFFFATLFFALRDFSLHKLEELARNNGGMGKLQPIVEDDTGHARALGLFRLVSNMLVLLTVVLLFTPLIEGDTFGWSGIRWENVAGAFGIAIVLLFLASLLLPVSVAQHAGERVIHSFSGVIRLCYVLSKPIAVLDFVDEAVKRLAGQGETTERDEIEDEIIAAVSEGERGGHLHAAEREMIRAVVELGETTVDEIMTPRTEVEGFELTDDLEEIKTFIREAGHSRIPVYEDDLDHIVGLLYAKDLIPWAGVGSETFVLRDILRPVTLVPERKRVSELLTEMQRDKVHLAIVVDEYGGTAGLVTLEDIVEEIVGEIQDEYEPEHEHDPEVVIDFESRRADADARVSVSDANEELRDLRIEIEESDDYDTLGGWVLSVLGRIPAVSETFDSPTARVEIIEAEPTRIHRIRFFALLEPVPEESRSGSKDLAASDVHSRTTAEASAGDAGDTDGSEQQRGGAHGAGDSADGGGGRESDSERIREAG